MINFQGSFVIDLGILFILWPTACEPRSCRVWSRIERHGQSLYQAYNPRTRTICSQHRAQNLLSVVLALRMKILLNQRVRRERIGRYQTSTYVLDGIRKLTRVDLSLCIVSYKIWQRKPMSLGKVDQNRWGRWEPAGNWVRRDVGWGEDPNDPNGEPCSWSYIVILRDDYQEPFSWFNSCTSET